MHQEHHRIVAGASSAILFIHGILGTPNHFAPFIPQVPDSVSIYNLLLDGHGKRTQDFSRTSMEKWEAQVHAAVEELSASHENVYIVAHSMGTLLALGEAVGHSKIRELFLLALPIRLRLRPRLISNVLKVYFGRILPDDEAAIASRDACSVTLTKNPFAYLGWIPRYLELFRKISKTRKLLPALFLPCSVYQSAQDEMVSPASVPYLRKNSSFTVRLLENSEHYRYGENDLRLLQEDFQAFVQRACQDNNKRGDHNGLL